MATTIATAVTQVSARLNINETGGQPTNAQIETFIRQAFKRLWGDAPPIFRGEFQVAAGGVVSVGATLSEILYVSAPSMMLIPSYDYVETDEGIFLRMPEAAATEDVMVWYQTVPTTLGSDATIETTCVFGPDWLEEPALEFASMLALFRMSRRSDGAGGSLDGGGFVTLERPYEMILQRLNQQRNQFMARMDARVQVRERFAKGTMRIPGLYGIANETTRENRTTGVRPE